MNNNAKLGYSNTNNERSWNLDNYNWNSYNKSYLIRAEVLYPDGKIGEVGSSRDDKGDLSGYNLYRNGILRETFFNINTVDYTDNGLPKGTYTYSVSAVYNEKESEISESTTIYVSGTQTNIDNTSLLVSDISLEQNYPNPFNSQTNINFSIKEDGFVTLSLYNVKGELVNKFYEQNLICGSYLINFDAANLNSGIYYYSLKKSNKTVVKKMILIK